MELVGIMEELKAYNEGLHKQCIEYGRQKETMETDLQVSLPVIACNNCLPSLTMEADLQESVELVEGTMADNARLSKSSGGTFGCVLTRSLACMPACWQMFLCQIFVVQPTQHVEQDVLLFLTVRFVRGIVVCVCAAARENQGYEQEISKLKASNGELESLIEQTVRFYRIQLLGLLALVDHLGAHSHPGHSFGYPGSLLAFFGHFGTHI